MNIYEQLNKINDNESLSEKYNVKNVKKLKKLRESSTEESKPDLNTVTKKLLDAFPVLQDEENSTEAERISHTIYRILLFEYSFGSREERERHEQEEKAKRHDELASNPEPVDAIGKFKRHFPDVEWEFRA